MLNRRKLVQSTAFLPAAFLLPSTSFAQDDDKPDFTIAGSQQTDPPGYEVAWSDDWEQTDLEGLTFSPIPGERGYIVLDLANPVSNRDTQRIVIESHASNEAIDPEWLIETFADSHPETEMGYAPGTVIETRKVTDRGCWFSFGAGDDSFVPGVIGLSLYYIPTTPGEPLLNVVFNIHKGLNRSSSEHLEFIDSTISLNGDWLLGMDDLDEYWDALTTSLGYDYE